MNKAKFFFKNENKIKAIVKALRKNVNNDVCNDKNLNNEAL